MEDQHLLRELARRLREARRASGLSVSDLATRSGLSRRYVTEVEAGRANPTLVKLVRLSEALDLPLARLVDFGARGRPRSGRVALIGLRGAGKSTVGRRLALALEVPFVELDQRVERHAGLPLGEIFDLHGPEYFHELEAEVLEKVLSEGDAQVLATSGSFVRSTRNYDRLRATCRSVWLRARAEDHFQRVLDQGDRRPMANRPRAMEELAALLAERSAEYARCEIVVDTSGRTVDDVERELLARLAD